MKETTGWKGQVEVAQFFGGLSPQPNVTRRKRPVRPPVNLDMAEAPCDFHGGMGNGIGIEKAGVGTTGERDQSI